MAQVPERVLSWLWSVLQPYTQPQVAYNDIAGALSAYPSLQPRTAVYTYENGQSTLLLCLSGTLPVDFRGSQYRFPLEVWVPQEYGKQGAGVLAYVRPGLGKDGVDGDIAIRPGQHVAMDGRVYHPYLRDWNTQRRSSIVEFLRIAQQIFAKEPPVVAKQHQSFHGQSQGQAPPPPPPPPKAMSGPSRPIEMSASPAPPPVPSKPGQAGPSASSSSSHRSRNENGPPLPPLPHQQPQHASQNGAPVTPPRPDRGHTQTSAGRYGAPPPIPPLPVQALQHQAGQTNGDRSPVSPISPVRYTEGPYDRQQRPPPSRRPQVPPQQQQQQQARSGMPPHQQQPQYHQRAIPQQSQYQGYQQTQQPYQYNGQPMPQQMLPQQKTVAPAPDLLTDPFDISLPASTTATGPPPPIPPNPEKEHLLSMLSQTFVSQINAKLQQNTAAIAPLRAQNAALQEAHARLNGEIAQLQSLDSVLSTNEAILHQSLRDCDSVIEVSAKTAEPNIDEVLVAPTVASQQLWNLCAEEAAIREALWCLQRAVDAGRVGGTEFVRLTRGLAREAFLKMALARKLANGLGLDLGPGKDVFSTV